MTPPPRVVPDTHVVLSALVVAGGATPRCARPGNKAAACRW